MQVARDSVDNRAGLDVTAQLLDQLLRDPAVAFGPSERSFFLRVARCEIVDAGPGGSVLGQRAVIVAAGVVYVPAQRTRGETLGGEPVRHRNMVQRGGLGAALHGDGEFARGAELVDLFVEAAILIAVVRGCAQFRLDAFLPATVAEQTLLGIEAESPIVPLDRKSTRLNSSHL